APALRRRGQTIDRPRGLLQAAARALLRGSPFGTPTHGGGGRPPLIEMVRGLRSLREVARPLLPNQDPRTLRVGGLPELLRED
ncbi:MAG: hypothetical protein AVDCRST_MAG22-681, partial [uncultured Rubrobacteraceae bacterium]